MRRSLPLAALALLLAAPSALGATASFSAGTLTVDGSAGDESITLSRSGATYQVVASSGGMSDPDGAGTECSGSGTTVACATANTLGVVLNGNAGKDVIANLIAQFGGALEISGGTEADDITVGDDSADVQGGAGDDKLRAGLG